MDRRKFVRNVSLTGAALAGANALSSCKEEQVGEERAAGSKHAGYPVVAATWDVQKAVSVARDHLADKGSALDAVELGCRVEEANEEGQSVGKGGRPDRDGRVTLDACIMDHLGNVGSVLYLQDIMHAVSVARRVMEDTPHVMLAGDGARKFALDSGFKSENLLTEQAKKDWEEWKVRSEYDPVINVEQHDTIGMLAINHDGHLSGACSTSGVAYKMAGRVGDSPIIGAGLFIDNEVGGCTATGMGEEVLKTVGSFLVVELMRQGRSPQQACKEAIDRIVKKAGKRAEDFQVGYVALNKSGETGSYSIHPGFSMTKGTAIEVLNIQSRSYF